MAWYDSLKQASSAVGTMFSNAVQNAIKNSTPLSDIQRAKNHIAYGASHEQRDSFDSMEYQSLINQELMREQHELNENSAQAARDFNAAEAQKSRDFSEMQRSTQYQTTVADLKAAGLNPALAIQNGGSGVSGSAMASSAHSNVDNLGINNPFGQIASAAITSAASIANNAITNQTNLEINEKNIESTNLNKEVDRWFGLVGDLIGLGGSAMRAAALAPGLFA